MTRQHSLRKSWISDQNDFSYFWSACHPNASKQVSNQLTFLFRRRTEKNPDFQDGHHGGHLGYLIGMFYLFLTYMSAQCFLPSLESIGLWVQEKKRKKDFQDGHHGCHLWFPIGTVLAILDLKVTPMPLTKFWVNWPFGSGEEAKNRFSVWGPFWFPIGTILAIFDLRHPTASNQVLSQLAFQFRRRSEK